MIKKDSIQIIDGGVTVPKGFLAASHAAGIKKDGSADMAMIASRLPCTAAGVFTQNLACAAPVTYDRELLKSGAPLYGVLVNSGIANACTGQEGMNACEETAKAGAAALASSGLIRQGAPAPENLLVCSTGVIGQQLPVTKLMKGASALAGKLAESHEAAHEAALAIMTTDTKPKEIAFSFTLSDGTEAHIGGMCKGSGMIHPNMCTMLSFVTTDAAITGQLLQKALSEDVKSTYNMVSVDGDTSTNDTCLLLANGLAGNVPIDAENEDYALFCAALHEVNEDLAKKIAGDGEGAECLFTVRAVHAATIDDARKMARTVVSSTLVKAAVGGHDANWGRILCAMGYAGVPFDPALVDISISGGNQELLIVKNGVATGYNEEEATKILSSHKVMVVCDLKNGDASAEAWGCDLTHAYVTINGDYRS